MYVKILWIKVEIYLMFLLDINDKKIWYKQSKNNGKNYLLLHNAGGDHSFLLPQFEMLSNM